MIKWLNVTERPRKPQEGCAYLICQKSCNKIKIRAILVEGARKSVSVCVCVCVCVEEESRNQTEMSKSVY